jgi:hypothetical protein
MTLPADPHTDNFLSPVIRNENGESMPAAILREFLGNNESMLRRRRNLKKPIPFRPGTGYRCQRESKTGLVRTSV